MAVVTESAWDLGRKSPAERRAAAIRSADVGIATRSIEEIGGVIGTHVGPHAVGVTYAPA